MINNIIKSYAKINIHLEILNRRRDNYHNLFSLMAELELCDSLKLEKTDVSKNAGETSIKIISSGGELSSIIDEIPVEKNLISIAVRNYLDIIGSAGDFTFSISKNIPSGAGLGGGSSNAAAALKLVSGVFNRGVDDDLRKAASATGSDVPFFLEGGFAFAEGRGENVSPVDFENESYILLVNNGIHINTGFAYSSLNKSISGETVNCSERINFIIERISNIEEWKNIFRNDFEESIFKLHPQIGLLKEYMYKNGACFASMTGSGSTVFGLFQTEFSAKSVQKWLENSGNRTYLTKFRSKKN